MGRSVAATFCATLVDEWARRGVSHAFVAPGSRSTPLLVALDGDQRITLHVFHDERSASFAALGYGNATGVPGVVLCTSGTAATHFHAAVVEADLSAVPMIVCTADRPPELWDRGSPQTIDQTRLYGSAVRLFAQPGPADGNESATWRPVAADLADHAAGRRGGRAGPVHANLSFRDPLVGSPGPLPDPIALGTATAPPSIGASQAADVAAMCHANNGVIIAGRGVSTADRINALATRLGWPVIADHQSGVRSAATISHADALLRHAPFADSQRPGIVLRFGEAPASKSLSQWLSACAANGSEVVALHQPGRLIDPETIATMVVPELTAAEAILAELDTNGIDSSTRVEWQTADTGARVAATTAISAEPNSEVAIAIRALHAAGPDGIVVAASSMPIRYIEWFDSYPDETIRVISNRGANGIDGVLATAIGSASTGAPTVCLLGDVAFLHDSSSLAALAQRDLQLTIVVLDNDGGGIFSFLPQAEQLEADRFDRLFGTPHGTDLTALAASHGIDTGSVTDDLTPNGIRVVVARCADRSTNASTVRRINQAIAGSLA